MFVKCDRQYWAGYNGVRAASAPAAATRKHLQATAPAPAVVILWNAVRLAFARMLIPPMPRHQRRATSARWCCAVPTWSWRDAHTPAADRMLFVDDFTCRNICWLEDADTTGKNFV